MANIRAMHILSKLKIKKTYDIRGMESGDREADTARELNETYFHIADLH